MSRPMQASFTTPTIKIFTPPSSPMTPGQEEWDNVDDFSIDSLPIEESSSYTAQSFFTPSSPPDEVNNEELSNEYDVPKNSSTEILQKMGHWFYNTRFVQYMKSDERSRVKHVYTVNPIWILGVEYKFPENGVTVVSLPKPDKGEHALSGRTSSLLNFIMFGSSEDDNDYNDTLIHDRHHSEDCVQTHKLGKSRSFSQTPPGAEVQQLGMPYSKGGQNAVIRRLRSLSFTRKSPPLSQPTTTPESSPPHIENRVNVVALNPVHLRSGGRRIRSFSFGKKKDLAEFLQTDTRSSLVMQKNIPISNPQTNNLIRSPNIKGSSMAPNFLRNLSGSSSSSNQGSEPSGLVSPSYQGGFSTKIKKSRRMTFAGIFSGREKYKFGGPLPSQHLYPHMETEGDSDPKYSGSELRLKRTSFGEIDNSRMHRTVATYPDDVLFSSEDEIEGGNGDTISRTDEADPETLSGDNVSIETVTKESITNNCISINSSNFGLIKSIDTANVLPAQKILDTASIRSLPVTPTSLYRPDSLGPLSPNQKKLMDFSLDFQSRIFFCYRKDFPPIEPAFHTTDTGWGCMHRTGQSLLAQGFLWVLLGRDWRLHNPQTDTDLLIYRKILRWFMDGPELEQYYSIHNIARVGISLDKKIGDWFGPATVAHALKRLSLGHQECPLVIYVPTDNTIYKSEVVNAAIGEHEISSLFTDKLWKPTLILLSVRLGTDKFNPSYSENLKTLFTFPQFLGIAGGRPGRSLYFVAVQDDELFYLDPHFVRPAINLNKVTDFPIEDYHSTIVRAMDIFEMDPSMLLGFLFQSSQDFDSFSERIEQVMNPQFPIFTVLNACPLRVSWSSSKSISEVSSSEKSLSEKSIIAVSEVLDDYVDDLKETSTRDDLGVFSVKEDEFEDNIFDLQFNNNGLDNSSVRRQSLLSDENYEYELL